jgi:hypothetical protein
VLHPVLRGARLFRQQALARAVGDHRQRRRREADLAQEGAEALERAVEHARVRRDVDADQVALDLALGEPLLERQDLRTRTRGHAQLGRVDAGQIELRAEQRAQLAGGERHAHHRAFRHLVHQSTAQEDQVERVFVLEYARDRRRRVLADRVADQRRRLDAERLPELGQRELDDEDQRQLIGRALELGRGLVARTGLREEQRFGIVRHALLEQVQTAIDVFAEHRLALV